MYLVEDADSLDLPAFWEGITGRGRWKVFINVMMWGFFDVKM